ncbi:MAG TPA: sugar ABC transporter ATP-binding protein [Planctomycetota bacterium]|nr:sugar ABC transporter ATP-binding protein [Planctomycetota bacterium]
MNPLLAVSGVTKAFAGVQALRGVSFDLFPGEVHALVGENGAGKSTLIKVITGAHRPDAGTLELEGRRLEHNSPLLSRSLGIAAIYQQPALFPDLSVAENMALGFESGSSWRIIDWRSRRARAKELLDRIGARIDPDSPVSALTMPEQQMVEIAKSLGGQAKVLIMDEPTAALPEHEVANLSRVVRELKVQGVGIIYISHRLDELYALADRVTVLRDGQTVATRPMKEVERPELIRLMVGREISAIFPKRDVPQGDVLLETRNLGCRASGVRGVSLSIRAGEIVGLAGLVGAGRTELAHVLFGLTPATEGEILLSGRPASIRTPADAVDLGVAYVPEDRRRHGVILEMPIAENATLAVLRRISRGGFIDFARERQIATSYVERLAVKTPSIDTPAGNLSGGNQQKVALSRWLATEPKVLILDEPTQGIDVGAKSEIHRLMVDLAARGLAILMISSELPEILGMSDRVGVLRGGALAGMLTRQEATQERVMALALGHAEGAAA